MLYDYKEIITLCKGYTSFANDLNKRKDKINEAIKFLNLLLKDASIGIDENERD